MGKQKWKNSTEMWQFPTQPTTVRKCFHRWNGAVLYSEDVWKDWKTMSHNEQRPFFPLCLLRAVILYPAVQLMMPFKISCRLSLRRRLPAWSEGCMCTGGFISATVHVSVHITALCVRAGVGGRSQAITDGFWQVTSRTEESINETIWQTGDLVIAEIQAFPPVRWKHTVYPLPCQGRQEDISRKEERRRKEGFVNRETRLVGQNWQLRVEQNQILKTIYSL